MEKIGRTIRVGIYRLYWNNNPHFYYGQTRDFISRRNHHLNELKKSTHFNKRMRELSKIYGLPKFEIVEWCETKNLNDREQYYIDLFIKDPNCCNVSPTAGSCKGVKRSEAHKQRLREFNTGWRKSEITRMKISAAKKNLTDEQRKRMSDGQKGKVLSDAHRRKISEGVRRLGADYRERMRVIKTGTYTGAENHASKLVLNLETGIYYDSGREACTQTNYKYGYFKLMLADNSTRNKTSFIYA